MSVASLSEEKARIIASFEGADQVKLAALDNLIEQAAYETIYLRQLNMQALESGLVKIHPQNPGQQRSLPISAEIARHSAALTNIMDKLMKHLAVSRDVDEDNLLADFEEDD